MGVKGLWRLLLPIGRRISIETLEGQILAVDASIWMTQFLKAMRDDDGKARPACHLVGFFRRLCKLRYHGIRPVIVFDGATPEIKRRELAARRRRRDQFVAQHGTAAVQRMAKRLLVEQLQRNKNMKLLVDGKKSKKKKKRNIKLLSAATANQNNNPQKQDEEEEDESDSDSGGGAYAVGFNLPESERQNQQKTSSSAGGEEEKKETAEIISVDDDDDDGIPKFEWKDGEFRISAAGQQQQKKKKRSKGASSASILNDNDNDWDKPIEIDDDDDDDDSDDQEEEEDKQEEEDEEKVEYDDVLWTSRKKKGKRKRHEFFQKQLKEDEFFDEEYILQLEPTDRKEAIEAARKKQRMLSRKEFMPVAANADEYSQTQLRNFLRSSKLNRDISTMAKKAVKIDYANQGIEEGEVLAGDRTRRIIYETNIDESEANKNNKRQKNQSSSEEESESDDDSEGGGGFLKTNQRPTAARRKQSKQQQQHHSTGQQDSSAAVDQTTTTTTTSRPFRRRIRKVGFQPQSSSSDGDNDDDDDNSDKEEDTAGGGGGGFFASSSKNIADGGGGGSKKKQRAIVDDEDEDNPSDNEGGGGFMTSSTTTTAATTTNNKKNYSKSKSINESGDYDSISGGGFMTTTNTTYENDDDDNTSGGGGGGGFMAPPSSSSKDEQPKSDNNKSKSKNDDKTTKRVQFATTTTTDEEGASGGVVDCTQGTAEITKVVAFRPGGFLSNVNDDDNNKNEKKPQPSSSSKTIKKGAHFWRDSSSDEDDDVHQQEEEDHHNQGSSSLLGPSTTAMKNASKVVERLRRNKSNTLSGRGFAATGKTHGYAIFQQHLNDKSDDDDDGDGEGGGGGSGGFVANQQQQQQAKKPKASLKSTGLDDDDVIVIDDDDDNNNNHVTLDAQTAQELQDQMLAKALQEEEDAKFAASYSDHHHHHSEITPTTAIGVNVKRSNCSNNDKKKKKSLKWNDGDIFNGFADGPSTRLTTEVFVRPTDDHHHQKTTTKRRLKDPPQQQASTLSTTTTTTITQSSLRLKDPPPPKQTSSLGSSMMLMAAGDDESEEDEAIGWENGDADDDNNNCAVVDKTEQESNTDSALPAATKKKAATAGTASSVVGLMMTGDDDAESEEDDVDWENGDDDDDVIQVDENNETGTKLDNNLNDDKASKNKPFSDTRPAANAAHGSDKKAPSQVSLQSGKEDSVIDILDSGDDEEEVDWEDGDAENSSPQLVGEASAIAKATAMITAAERGVQKAEVVQRQQSAISEGSGSTAEPFLREQSASSDDAFARQQSASSGGSNNKDAFATDDNDDRPARYKEPEGDFGVTDPTGLDDFGSAPKIDNEAALHQAETTAANLTNWAGRAVRRAIAEHLGEAAVPKVAPVPESVEEEEEDSDGMEVWEQKEPVETSAAEDRDIDLTLNEENAEAAAEILEGYENELAQAAKNNMERETDTVTDEMQEEIMALLQLFGVPWVQAPAEAEAQCVALEQLGLVNGIITEDSDVFVFGGKTVYKNIFDDQKYVEVYQSDDAEREMGLGHNEMVALAMLLGGDYTEGVKGVGIVNGMEIVSSFDVSVDLKQGLQKFRTWLDGFEPIVEANARKDLGKSLTKEQVFHLKHRTARSRFHPPETFPSDAVISAYVNPVVDKSKTKFSFGVPDTEKIIAFCNKNAGWVAEDTRRVLEPVVDRVENKRSYQTRIDQFMRYEHGIKFANVRSKRLRQVLAGSQGEDDISGLLEAPAPKRRGKKKTSKSSKSSAKAGEDQSTVHAVPGVAFDSRTVSYADDFQPEHMVTRRRSARISQSAVPPGQPAAPQESLVTELASDAFTTSKPTLPADVNRTKSKVKTKSLASFLGSVKTAEEKKTEENNRASKAYSEEYRAKLNKSIPTNRAPPAYSEKSDLVNSLRDEASESASAVPTAPRERADDD